jgi:hypothetical protein
VGHLTYDDATIVPEVAARWELVDDGAAMLFHLQPESP